MRYGSRIMFNQIDIMNESDYRETTVGVIAPDWVPGITGTHTYAESSRFEVLDARADVAKSLYELVWPAFRT